MKNCNWGKEERRALAELQHQIGTMDSQQRCPTIILVITWLAFGKSDLYNMHPRDMWGTHQANQHFRLGPRKINSL